MSGNKSKDDSLRVSCWSVVYIEAISLINGIQQAATQYARGKLVDIGCGVKPYKKIFEPFVESYFGIDYAPAASVHYGAKTEADLFADCTATGLDSNSFDTLLSTQVMEHIFDVQSLVAECYRLLKPGGFGIFTVPMTCQYHAEPYDYHRFTKYSLTKYFENAGFKIISIDELEGMIATLIQLFIVLSLANCSANIISRLIRKVLVIFVVPVLNVLGLFLDKVFNCKKICLDYIVVVQKV